MTHISSLVPSLCQIFVSVSACYTNSCVFFWWSLIFCALRAFGIVFMSCYPDVSTCLLSVYVTSVWLCLNPRAFPPDFYFVFVDIGILYSGFALATIKEIYVVVVFFFIALSSLSVLSSCISWQLPTWTDQVNPFLYPCLLFLKMIWKIKLTADCLMFPDVSSSPSSKTWAVFLVLLIKSFSRKCIKKLTAWTVAIQLCTAL